MRRNDPVVQRRIIGEAAAVFAGINDAGTMQKFFAEIFTPAECTDIALRWHLMTLLHKGMPQRAVAAELGISLCKITRGAKVLKKGGSVSRAILTSSKNIHPH